MQPTSRITSKGRTTIPREVTAEAVFEAGRRARVRARRRRGAGAQAGPLDVAYLRAVQTTLSEWDSPEDAAAFDDL